MRLILTAYTLSECMETMAEYVEAYEKQGRKNLIFCEDRLTLIAERALARRVGGTFLSSVSTFSRFLSSDQRTISKQGSVMAVGEVITRLQKKGALQCFTSAASIGNNAKGIYETLAQLSASEVTPQTLKESLSALPEDHLRRKIADLALIYEGYVDFLEERDFLDESRYLSLLPDALKKEKSLKDANVFFLCYNSFTAQAAQAIRAAAETAANAIGIFCSGTEDLYTNHAAETFKRVCKEYGEVKIVDCGAPLEGEAERLRKGLFNPERPEKRVFTNAVNVFEAEDRIAEAEYVAVQIRKALTENANLRYRDFAVLIPDTQSYALPLKRALGEYGIPYFLDEKKSLKSHPISRFLLDCFRVAREKYSPAAVQSLAQNIFFGESDEYRNYLLKFANYRGGAKRAIKTGEAVESLYSLPDLENGRERLLKATKNIKQRGQGRDYCAAVRKIIADFEIEKRLKSLQDEIDDLSQKSYLSQIHNALFNVLEEAELLTAGNEMTVAEFESILRDGLDATEISLIPVKSDAVFVGSTIESRIEKVEQLFAMGLTDAVPGNAVDTAIISDKEIAKLAEVKTLLEPTVAEVNLRHRESVCLNLCTFIQKLHLSYALSADGSEPALSEIFRYVDGLYCDETGGKLPRVKTILAEDFKYKCSAPAPALRQLLVEKSDYENLKRDTRREYSSLFSALDKLSVQEKDDFLKESGRQVCVERGEELFFRDGKISPTALESFFGCPFRHFAERGLRLKERDETAVLAVDTGNFVHALLEKTAPVWATIDTEEEMREYAMKEGAEILKSPVYASQADTASGEFFSLRLLAEGAEVAVAAYRQIKNSEFTVEETEKTITTPEFNGKVDRVDGTDEYIRIIDYKTGNIDDKPLSYYVGKKIQMQLYMSSLKGERIPAGVFYFPASVSYQDSDEGRYRMSGFLNGDEKALRAGDKNITEDKKSDYFPAALKNGAAAKRLMPEDVFRDFLDYSVYVARQGKKELQEGYIEATPYGGCEYCKYGGLCGFDKDVGAVRAEQSIDTHTIAKIAKETREGKENGNE